MRAGEIDSLGGDCRLVPNGTSSVASGVRIGARWILMPANGSASNANARTKQPS